MKFYKELYCSKRIVSRKRKICWKLKHNVGQLNIYVILLSKGADQLEIIHCAYLQQKTFDKKELCIVGIADRHDEALLIICDMMQEVVTQTGGANIKEYLISRW